jgi:hypothetical protein
MSTLFALQLAKIPTGLSEFAYCPVTAKGLPQVFQPNCFKGTSTLWLFNIAMENGLFIDGLPIKNGDFL